MGLGTMLVTIAVLVGVSAYVAWPFRRADVNTEKILEAWILQVKSEQVRATQASDDSSGLEPASLPDDAREQPPVVIREPDPVGCHRWVAHPNGEPIGAGGDEAINFCPYCGRSVEPDHVFCPKCGRQLAKGRVA